MAGPGILRDYNSIMAEFSMCMKSLVDIGMDAGELLNSKLEEELNMEVDKGLDKEQNIQKMKEQLQWVIEIAEKLQQISKRDSKVKKCNFYNRGFCKKGFSCGFDHSESKNCETFSELGVCYDKKCNKRHPYTCKYLKTVSGCFRGEDCAFNHDVNVTKLETDTERSIDEQVEEIEQKADELFEKAEDSKSKEVNEIDDASSVAGAAQESRTENNITDLIEVSEEVEETVDAFYSDLTAAMAAQNENLQNAIMDKILEAYDKKEESLEEKKEPKKLKKEKVNPKVKGKKRGQGSSSTNL